MHIIVIITYSIWFLSETLITNSFVFKNLENQNGNKVSNYQIWVISFSCILAATYTSSRYHIPILDSPTVSYFGLIIIYFGIILKLDVITSLVNFFIHDTPSDNNYSIKKSGLYKYLRHPSYFASFISYIGFGISLNNMASLALVFIVILSAFTLKIRKEEKVLLDLFGDEYLEYKKTTKKMIPFIY